jgi:hypothetical protein
MICGKEFVVKESKRYETARFCSPKCWGQYNWLENKLDIVEVFNKLKKSRLPVAEFAKKQGYYYATLKNALKRQFPADYTEFIDIRLSRMDKRYKKGREFEYQTRDFFKTQGYFVLRSPHSLGPVDLVALKMNEILLIQCKVAGMYLRPKEKEKLISLAKSIGAKAIVAYRQNGIKLKFIN